MAKVKEWFEGRCIMQTALDAYKVGQQGDTIVFPFFSPDGELELVKYRDLENEKQTGKKKIWSNEDPEYHLWGWQAIDDDTREVVICEGEIDALTWFQQGVPALSVPNGGGKGNKQTIWIDNDYERLQRFACFQWKLLLQNLLGAFRPHPRDSSNILFFYRHL